MLATAISQLVTAGALIALGWWGRYKAHALTNQRLDDGMRLTRIRTVRRGAFACQIVGVLFAVATIVALLAE